MAKSRHSTTRVVPGGIVNPELNSTSAPLVRMGVGEGFPKVQGRCPACRMSTLFVGAGGYITCSWLSCPDPGAASDLLEGPKP